MSIMSIFLLLSPLLLFTSSSPTLLPSICNKPFIEVLRFKQPSFGQIYSSTNTETISIRFEYEMFYTDQDAVKRIEQCGPLLDVCAMIDDNRPDRPGIFMSNPLTFSRPSESDFRTYLSIDDGFKFIGCTPLVKNGVENSADLTIPVSQVPRGVHLISLFVTVREENVVTSSAPKQLRLLAPKELVPQRPMAIIPIVIDDALRQDIPPAVPHVWSLHEDLEPAASISNNDDFLVFSISINHDASCTVVQNGIVLVSIELERIFNERYFRYHFGSIELFRQELLITRDAVAHALFDLYGLKMPTYWNLGVLVDGEAWNNDWADWLYQYSQKKEKTTQMKNPIQYINEMFPCKQWKGVGHQYSHAVLGYHSAMGAPFFSLTSKPVLIVSYDGGGSDGLFSVFISRNNQNQSSSSLHLLANFGYNPGLGNFYETMASMFEEIEGSQDACDFVNKPGSCLRLPGILMGYAALGIPYQRPNKVRICVEENVYNLRVQCSNSNLKQNMSRNEQRTHERNLAATVQSVFEDVLIDLLSLFVESPPFKNKLQGIVLVGGCSLNVKANSKVQQKFNLPVHVPSAPNDGGLSLGGAWAAGPPPPFFQPLQYIGIKAKDSLSFSTYANEWNGAKRTTPDIIGELLTKNYVLGVVRGRQEFGPRALGHRSLLASPSKGMKDRMNRIKKRAWFRPTAPVLAEEMIDYVFDNVPSTFVSESMSFTANVRDSIAQSFPAISHYDGSARPQTVSKYNEPWLHRVLMNAWRKGGLPCLINTSFNVRGEPMINSGSVALLLLCTEKDLDYVLLDDWLFGKEGCNKG